MRGVEEREGGGMVLADAGSGNPGRRRVDKGG